MAVSQPQEDGSNPVFIGLSFGTLYSTISIVGKDGKHETIANEDGVRNIPSCVAFTSHDELVGSQAKLQAIRNPRNTIVQFRNLLAKSFDHKDVKLHAKELRLAILSHPDNEEVPAYEVDFWTDPNEEPEKRYLTAADITTKYLAKMKATAEAYLGVTVQGCVISDPTSFEEDQTAALVEATKSAGFEHVFTVKEPVAAALSFTDDGDKPDKLVLVLDFGGHAFNVSLLSSNKGLYSILASTDDLKLGGVHLDDVLVNLVADEFKRKTKMDLRENRRSVMKLKNACEQTKRALSQLDMAPCSVESLHEGVDYHGSINRSRFEGLAEPLFQRCAALVVKTLEKQKLSADHIDSVVMVGGSSKVPRFQTVIRNLFPDDMKFYIDSDPDESIAKGCIAQATIIQSAGLEHYEKACLDKSLTKHVPCTCKDIGIADANGNMCVLIPRGTPIPVLRTIRFSNSVKGQSDLFVTLYEGNEKSVSGNNLLAEIVISDIPDGLNVGEAMLDVTLSIEKNFSLHVVCKEKSSGKVVSCEVKK